MKSSLIICIGLIMGSIVNCVQAQTSTTVEKIVIPPSEHRVVSLTMDLYKPIEELKGVFVLYHQAGSSRGEYIEIAQRLNRNGYLCFAVDLRSGKSMNGIDNETYQSAKLKMRGTNYLDAYTDMQASLEYVNSYLKTVLQSDSLSLFVMSSSYSAALTPRLLVENQTTDVKAAFLFSPGEYFENINGDDLYVSKYISKINTPIWATSSRNEIPKLEQLLKNAPESILLEQYKPTSSGQHGAKALWSKFVDSEDYWESMLSFLSGLN